MARLLRASGRRAGFEWSDPLKILFFTNSLQLGGIETNLVRLARELCPMGHQVMGLTSGGVLLPEFEAAGARHIQVPLSSSPGGAVAGVSTLRRVLAEECPDIVHCFSASTTPLAALTLRSRGRAKSKIPLVASIMGLEASTEERGWITKPKVLMTTLGADRVIVTAPAIEAVLRSLPVSERRLTRASVVGVEIPDLSEVRAERAHMREMLGCGPNAQVVITIGALESRKSHEYFVRASGVLARDYPNARFFIVGEGSHRERLEHEIEALGGLGRQVTLLGPRVDAPRLMRGADLVVRPGLVEGFIGITALEAQACGLPVVSFETEDVKLAIVHEETGLLARNGDHVDLARQMKRVLDDPVLASRISQGGRRLVSERYAMSQVARRLLEIYETEIEAARSSGLT